MECAKDENENNSHSERQILFPQMKDGLKRTKLHSHGYRSNTFNQGFRSVQTQRKYLSLCFMLFISKIGLINQCLIIFKEYVKTAGNCKKISSIREGNRYENVKNTEFKDRNCQDRCDKNSSCTGYLLPRNLDHNWCTTYTSVGLTGNGRDLYDCWMKGK